MTDADRERLAQIRRDMTLERRYPDGQILHGYQATGVSDALWLLNLAERLAAERDRLRNTLYLDDETLGRLVRLAWVAWAKEQPNPRPDWLLPWEELPEPIREVDRRIGHLVASQCGLMDRSKSIEFQCRAIEAEHERDRLREAAEVIRDLEWSLWCGFDENREPRRKCPMCGVWKYEPHGDNCKVSRLLAALAPPAVAKSPKPDVS